MLPPWLRWWTLTRNARRALELLYDARTAGDVAKTLGISPSQAHRALEELRTGGHVTVTTTKGVLLYKAAQT